MSRESKVSPTPWSAPAPWAGYSEIRSHDGKLVFGITAGTIPERQEPEVCAANLDFTLAACNAHAALVSALEAVTKHNWCHESEEALCAMKQARAALALAKGGETCG